MNERDGFLRSIISAPADDTPRLVFADWLQEQGDDARAEFIRVQCALATAHFREMSLTALEYGDVQPFDVSDPKQVAAASECAAEMRRTLALRKRESALFVLRLEWFWDASWLFDGGGFVLSPEYDHLRAQLVVRRGFIDEIVCRAEDWFVAADALCWRETVPCPGCNGLKRVTVRARGRDAIAGCKRCGGSDFEDGSGVVENPCPDTAQPIRKVTITALPTADGPMQELAAKHKFDWLPTEAAVGTDANARRFTAEVFAKEWDGVEFAVEITETT